MRWKLALITGYVLAGSSAIAVVAQEASAPVQDQSAAVTEPAPEPRSLRDLTRILRSPDLSDELDGAVAELDAMVADGNADAALLLGAEYTKNRGTLPLDYNKATSYLEQAAALGRPEAYLTLSNLHRRETGGLHPAKTLDYLRAAADAGLDPALMPLADALRNGIYGDPDIGQAIHYYETALAAGDTTAAKRLVSIYRSGTDGPDDGAMYAKYLRVIADNGDVAAMRSLGNLYLRGSGVEQDPGLAEQYLRAAFDAGDETAGTALANALLRGQLGAGREADGVAVQQSAFDAGNVAVAAPLADAYIRGRGVDADLPRALAILRSGTDVGDSSAKAALFNLYVRGSGRTLAPDMNAARTLYASIPADERTGSVAADAAILAAQGKRLEDFAEVWSLFRGLDSTLQARTGQQLMNANANAYVYVLQGLMTERGHYSGSMTGQLGSSTIAAINEFCAEQNIADECRFGPLSRSTWTALSDALAQ